MKKINFILAVLICCIYFFSCSQPAEKTTPPKTNENIEVIQMIASSDCFSCHKVNEPATGPSYTSVAMKYSPSPETKEILVSHIINGSTGVWGQIPMSPHPSLSKEDAGKMVDYIFSLKN